MGGMTRTPSEGPALEWGIKRSLVQYVIGMPDGSASVLPPARVAREGFRFPAADPARTTDPRAAGVSDRTLRFAGTVTLSGHSGMLRLVFEDPWLVPGAGRGQAWELTIADPYEPGSRLTFAAIERLELDAAGGGAANGTRLTAAGADLFASGPYADGTELDDPVVVARG